MTFTSPAQRCTHSQVLQAPVEADPSNGPSVVLAYLPYTTEETPALEILKGNNASYRSRYWPLYCWNPAKEGNEPFSLDSDSVKNELQAFLDRQIHLSQLVRSKPDFCGACRKSL